MNKLPPTITLKDPVYGRIQFIEPILIELINSPSLQRLKTVSQMGIPEKYHCIPTFSRYDHSLGVAYLLKLLGATLEEQVAGLLHDVSVPAFSHVLDFAFGKGKSAQEDYHDALHEKFILKSEIPKILIQHNFSVSRITNPQNYSLLERPAPKLCADRVDYGLREFVHWLNPYASTTSLSGLINVNGEIVFKDIKTAYAFASNFVLLQKNNWGAEEPILRYVVFADLITYLVKSKHLKINDFFQDENLILKKIEKFDDLQVKDGLKLLKRKDFMKFYKRKGERIYKKFRHVDPKVFSNNKLTTLTNLSSKYSRLLEQERTRTAQGVMS